MQMEVASQKCDRFAGKTGKIKERQKRLYIKLAT